MRWISVILSIVFLSYMNAQTDLVYKNLSDALKAQEQGKTVLHIDLSKNKLSELPEEILNFPKLTSLNLDKNKLKSLPQWMGEFQNLEHLSASKNKFETFPDVILELKNLRTLKLGDNMIDAIPIDIDNLEKLESLWLWSNVIRTYPASLSEIESLTFIDLLYNDMTYEEQTWLKELLQDVVIDLSEPCTCDFDD